MTEYTQAPDCPYCGETSRLVDSSMVYGVSRGLMYLCRNWPACDAYVGVHHGTDQPKGTLADKELRDARVSAHEVFDPLWKGAIAFMDWRKFGRYRRPAMKACSAKARDAGYRWLAKRLGIGYDACHFGLFDLETCKKAVACCRQAAPKDIFNET